MKKEKTKGSRLWSYGVMWILALICGFMCWIIAYTFNASGTENSWALSLQGAFLLGLFCGIFGTFCYFAIFTALTPIAKWLWGKLRHNPKAFLELLT